MAFEHPGTSAIALVPLCLTTGAFIMKLFKRKPKPPLEDAICMVGDAVEVAYKYLRDHKHMPTEEELRLLDGLVAALWSNHSTAQYIVRNMRQRANGEPEGAKKFTDPKVFDWHYPE